MLCTMPLRFWAMDEHRVHRPATIIDRTIPTISTIPISGLTSTPHTTQLYAKRPALPDPENPHSGSASAKNLSRFMPAGRPRRSSVLRCGYRVSPLGRSGSKTIAGSTGAAELPSTHSFCWAAAHDPCNGPKLPGVGYIAGWMLSRDFLWSNSMLEAGQTTQWDYPEKSGFGRPTEREWGHQQRRWRLNRRSSHAHLYHRQ